MTLNCDRGDVTEPEQRKMCGGIAGFQCPAGYTCEMEASYPDAAGVCVPGEEDGTDRLRQTTGGEARVDCDRVADDRETWFRVRGADLVMNGVIDTDTPAKLKRALSRGVKLRRVVLECVYGSADDDANFVAARMVRARKLNTHLASGGEIASGGTDFFIAGVRRSVGRDVKIGVHSWSGDEGEIGSKFPRDDPEHRKYLDYYKEMGIPAAFYWFTLDAAGPDDIHNMTRAELKKYRIVTP